ncbi:MAG: hypothetical protein RQ739_07375 [Desulfotignum sp.]|nr:hypothetical protein [Desulfotignum sp.]
MKTRVSAILLTAMFLFPNFAYPSNERFCQPGVFVFFGNGIWNDKEDADLSRDLLAGRLESHISGSDLDGLITYATAHNPSDGILLDLLETFAQNNQTGWSRFWRFLAGLDPIPDFLQNKLKEIANTIDESILQMNPAVQDHVEKYNKILSEGNKVLVLAHSQGNLFANIAYLGIDSQYIDGFGIVSVGNPDSYVAGGSLYTTLEEDIIIESIPLSLSANVDNFFGINLNDLTGHLFARSYMAIGRQAETKILSDIESKINSLNFPDTSLGNGIITATLTWGSNPDLDLHVFEPDGSHVYYERRYGSSGYLDYDDVNGYGPEHYYVSCDTIEPGTYRFGVNYYRGRSAETGTLSIQAGDQIRSRQQIFTKWFSSSGNATPYIMFEVQVTGSEEEGYEFVIQ